MKCPKSTAIQTQLLFLVGLAVLNVSSCWWASLSQQSRYQHQCDARLMPIMAKKKKKIHRIQRHFFNTLSYLSPRKCIFRFLMLDFKM